MRHIYYLGYYNTAENKSENRANALSATNKMTYIVSALEKLGYTVKIISPCPTLNNRFYKGKILPVGTCSNVKLFATFPNRPRLFRLVGRVLLRMSTMWYMLRHIKNGDTVIVYHSLALMNCVRWLKKLRDFRLILEVEELYGDVIEKPKVSARELSYFQIADGYIFPAKRLAKKVNIQEKPYVLIHGTYQVEPPRNCYFTEPELQNKIHCVYAGTLDPRKGAELAIRTAQYLPENYHIHILGFGTEQEISDIKEQIRKVQQTAACTVSYDGCLVGNDFIEFLQKCQIGLSPQNPTSIFNDTSFPSKILTYMANGLQVVTVRIPAIEESAVNQYLHYYNDATPENVAAVIQSAVELNENSGGRAALSSLDIEFTENLKMLLQTI